MLTQTPWQSLLRPAAGPGPHVCPKNHGLPGRAAFSLYKDVEQGAPGLAVDGHIPARTPTTSQSHCVPAGQAVKVRARRWGAAGVCTAVGSCTLPQHVCAVTHPAYTLSSTRPQPGRCLTLSAFAPGVSPLCRCRFWLCSSFCAPLVSGRACRWPQSASSSRPLHSCHNQHGVIVHTNTVPALTCWQTTGSGSRLEQR